MAGSVRVNLSITERIDNALSGYAELSGRTKTAIIMEAIGYQLPNWESAVRSFRAQERASLRRDELRSAVPVKVTAAEGRAALDADPVPSQADWNVEIERKKAAKAGTHRD